MFRLLQHDLKESACKVHAQQSLVDPYMQLVQRGGPIPIARIGSNDNPKLFFSSM